MTLISNIRVMLCQVKGEFDFLSSVVLIFVRLSLFDAIEEDREKACFQDLRSPDLTGKIFNRLTN